MLERFAKQNPSLARQVVYDVATGKAIRFVKDAKQVNLKLFLQICRYRYNW